jgi:hypothetical protein
METVVPVRRTGVPRSRLRRAVYAILTVAIAMIIGTIGFHYIEGMNYVNAVYMESMLATGQGPPIALQTDDGKIFASIMAFVSVGSVLTTVVFTLGPIATEMLREGMWKVESEARRLEEDIKEKEKRT